MNERDDSSRRRFLEKIAVTGVAFSSGCNSNVPDDDQDETTTGGTPTTTRADTATGTEEAEEQTQEVLASETESIGLRKVAGGLTAPVQFVDPGTESGRAFVVDQTGQIRVLTSAGIRDEPFLDLSDRLVDLGEDLPSWVSAEERGLLGLAFHPRYDENGKFYVKYSAPARDAATEDQDHTELLSEFRGGPDAVSADPTTERVLIEFPSPHPVHQAGTIVFGPDDYLYVSMGDGGVVENAQDTTENLLGGILRIDVDGAEGDRAYAVPDANPLVGTDGLDEYFAWGMRNPWRMSFDGGELYAADVGSMLYEEVNLVRKGENYGWPVKEGPVCVEVDELIAHPTECPDQTDTGESIDALRDPVIRYPREIDGDIIGVAVIGGYVYRQDSVPALTGSYVFGDYSSTYGEPSGSLFAAEPSSDLPWRMRELTVENSDDGELNRTILSFGRDRDGELYVLTSGIPPAEATDFSHRTGEAYEIVPPDRVESTVGVDNG